MGIQTVQALGGKLLCCVMPQAVNTLRSDDNSAIVQPTTAGSMAILGFNAGVTNDRAVRKDKRVTRSAVELVYGFDATEWTLDTSLLPAAAGTPPDDGEMIKATYGTETITGSTSVAYTLSDAQQPRQALTISVVDFDGVYGELLMGAWVEERTVRFVQGDEPMASYSGGAVRHIHTGYGTANGAGVSATSLVLQNGEAYSFNAGSIIQLGTTTNIMVTSRSDAAAAAHTLIIPSTTWADNDVVRPYTPWLESSLNGSPISGVQGQFDFGDGAGGTDSDVLVQGFEYTIKNNFTEVRPAGKAEVHDVNVGFREVTGTLTLWARRPDIIRLHRRKEQNVTDVNPMALTAVMGPPGAANKVTVAFPKVSFGFGAINVPEAEASTFELPFTALTTRTAGISQTDEITETWT